MGIFKEKEMKVEFCCNEMYVAITTGIFVIKLYGIIISNIKKDIKKCPYCDEIIKINKK